MMTGVILGIAGIIASLLLFDFPPREHVLASLIGGSMGGGGLLSGHTFF
jgi:hypothetical protein